MNCNQILDNFLNDSPSDEWIINHSGLPWLKLDLNIPWKKLHQEISSFKEYFTSYSEDTSDENSEAKLARKLHAARNNVDFPDKNWKLLTLHGVEHNIIMDHSNYKEYKDKNIPYKWTSIGSKCVFNSLYLNSILEIDTNTLIKYNVLEPGGFILPHSDSTDFNKNQCRSLTLFITHPQGCNFHFKNWGNIPASSGTAFLMNLDNYHGTNNESNEDRFHIMVRFKSGRPVWENFKDKNLVKRSFLKQLKCEN